MAVHQAKINDMVSHLNPDMRIALVVSEFNNDIMEPMIASNIAVFEKYGFANIDIYTVPGAYEIPAVTSQILAKWLHSLVLTLWCVIRWSTPHFDYICDAVSRGLMDLSMSADVPVIFWVLTCDTHEQAVARANDNYAIYGLNYLAQRGLLQHDLTTKHEEMMVQVWEIMEDLDHIVE